MEFRLRSRHVVSEITRAARLGLRNIDTLSIGRLDAARAALFPPSADGMRVGAQAHLSDVSSPVQHLAMPHVKPGSGISRLGLSTGTGSICP